jgi:hypothetical protein
MFNDASSTSKPDSNIRGRIIDAKFDAVFSKDKFDAE